MALTGPLAGVGLALIAACSPFGGGAFACTEDGQCTGGTDGRCESNGRCSFADGSCASGRRYGELSGDQAGACVGEVPIDAPQDATDATDAPPDTMTDAMIDAPPPAPFCNAAGEPALVACWEFEGNTNDASGDGNNAVATATTFVTGRVGMALAMTATSTVAVADTASLAPATITLEAWINPTQLPAAGTRAGIVDNDGSYGLFLTDTGITCSLTVAMTVPVTIATGTWTHVACTYDGTTVRLYVAGLPLQSWAGSGSLGGGNANGSQLGGNSPTGDRLVGALDQFRVWNVARTPAQICEAALVSPCP